MDEKNMVENETEPDNETKADKNRGNSDNEALPICMMLGVAAGLLLGKFLIGLIVGVLIGVTFDAARKKKDSSDAHDEKNTEEAPKDPDNSESSDNSESNE